MFLRDNGTDVPNKTVWHPGIIKLTAVNIKFFYTEKGASTFLGTLLQMNQIIWCHISEGFDVNKYIVTC
jgi:hypothetical protein